MSYLEYRKNLESLRYKFSDIGTVHFSGISGSDVLMFKNLILKNGKILCNYTTLSNPVNIIFLLTASGARERLSSSLPIRTLVSEASYQGMSFDATKNITLDDSKNFFAMDPQMQMLSYTNLRNLPSQDFTICVAGVFDVLAFEASSYFFYFEGAESDDMEIYPCYMRASESKTNTLEFFNGDSVFFQVDPGTKFILIFRVLNNNALYSTTDVFYNGRLVSTHVNLNNTFWNGLAGRCVVNKSNAFNWMMSSFTAYNKGLSDDECLALTNYVDVRDNYKSNIYQELSSNPLLEKISFDLTLLAPAALSAFINVNSVDNSVNSIKNMSAPKLSEFKLQRESVQQPKVFHNALKQIVFFKNTALLSDTLPSAELTWPFTMLFKFTLSALPTAKAPFFALIDSLNVQTGSISINAAGVLYFKFAPGNLDFSDNNMTVEVNKDYTLVLSVNNNGASTIFLNNKIYSSSDFVAVANNFSKFKIQSSLDMEFGLYKFYMFDKFLIYDDFVPYI